jgi:hypothetical protein
MSIPRQIQVRTLAPLATEAMKRYRARDRSAAPLRAGIRVIDHLPEVERLSSITYARIGAIALGPKPTSFAEDFIDFRRGTAGGSFAAAVMILCLASGAGFLLAQIAMGVATGRF